MDPFQYTKATDADAAIATLLTHERAAYLAGGTNLVDRMRRNVAHHDAIVDVSDLPLAKIEPREGGLRLGAMASNSATADHPDVRRDYPLLAEAILMGATDQLRNKATNGGNLMQRTRCYYFMSPEFPCNKREPGSGCPAIGGFNRILSVLGTSESCIASYPSDMSTALAALDATVRIRTANGGERSLPLVDFHKLPGDTPEQDNHLERGELITAIDLPAETKKFAGHSTYLKTRDRHSYAFALVSVAAGLLVEDGKIADARLALGSVAAKPWRDKEAEQRLVGQAPSPELFREVAEQVMADARGYGENDFKIELAKRAIVKAFMRL